MKRWEDIIKEKLEGYESPLPEGVFAGMHTLVKGAVPVNKGIPVLWALVAAVAAALAIVFFIPRAEKANEDIQFVQRSEEQTFPLPESESSSVEHITTVVAKSNSSLVAREVQPEQTVVSQEPAKEISQEEIPNSHSPFIPENTASELSEIKIRTLPVIVASGGALATIAALLVTERPSEPSANGTEVMMGEEDSGVSGETPAVPKDELLGTTHGFPFKVGVTTRICLSDRLFFTTGLNYSIYKSSFSYSLSGQKTQHAHYLGIPLRLDYNLVPGRWFDVYVGAGVEVSKCLYASMAGKSIKKDGIIMSLQGVGGLQLNITNRWGFYIEPELNWNVPSTAVILNTYRSEHPLEFSLATGIRYVF